jgi:hypothetical protein
MRTLVACLTILGLTVGMLGCVGPASSPVPPGSGPPTLAIPSFVRPTGPNPTIEVPPPIQ